MRRADGDLYGDPADAMEGCIQPEGYVDNDDDCDDTTISVSPTAAETCNEADDDGDTRVDEEVSPAPATVEHCGGCGLACPAGYTCDGTTCVDRPVKLVAATASTCALTEAGNVYCWGGNREGEIGIGSSDPVVDRPVQVSLAMRAVDIGLIGGATSFAAEIYSALACAILEDGTGLCWGTGVGAEPGLPPWGGSRRFLRASAGSCSHRPAPSIGPAHLPGYPRRWDPRQRSRATAHAAQPGRSRASTASQRMT